MNVVRDGLFAMPTTTCGFIGPQAEAEEIKARLAQFLRDDPKLELSSDKTLSDLATPGRPQPMWAQLMAGMRRKTLMVCPRCHDSIHNRQPVNTLT